MSFTAKTRVVVTFHDGSTNEGVVTVVDNTSVIILFDDQDSEDEAYEYEYELQPDGTYFEVNNQGEPYTIKAVESMDENDYLTLEHNGKRAVGTVTFRFDLEALAKSGKEGIKARLALRQLTDMLQKSDVETLDGSDMGVVGVYDHIPPHCTTCGLLMGASEIGDEFPEERCHEVCPTKKRRKTAKPARKPAPET